MFVEVFARASEGPSEFRLFLRVVNLVENLELSLGHHHLFDDSVFEFDINGKYSNSDFVMNARPAGATIRNRHDSFTREHVPCANNRMACEWYLARWRIDSEPAQNIRSIFSRFRIWWKDEDRLGEIHLSGDLHHIFVVDTF